MDTFNRFMVSLRGDGKIVVLNPPARHTGMDKSEVIALCGWLLHILFLNEPEAQLAMVDYMNAIKET